MLTPELVPLQKLKRLPRNPKSHDCGLLHTSIGRFGFLERILINRTTGHLLAGHGRVTTLQQLKASGAPAPPGVKRNGKDWLVPADYVELPEAEEEAAAVVLNRATEAGGWDDAQLAAVLADLAATDALEGTGFDGDDVDALLRSLAPLPGPDEPEEAPAPYMGVPNALYPTDNEWQIPLLDLARQADAVDLPVVTWGSQARTKRMKGTYHCYTSDDRYIELWVDPSPVVASGCVSAVEPNFSVYEQTPRAVGLYRIFQKRWISCYWQSQGLRVFVDLNVAEWAAELNLLGVPEGWRAYATRGYTDRMEATEREFELARERAGSDDLLFLVYGGGKAVAELCGRRRWVHVDEHMTRVRESRADGEG